MTLHEPARNAAKYGALSREEGRVTISWAEDDEKCLSLRWEEAGMPSVQPPVTHGFGMNLIERTISDQLGGGCDLIGLPAASLAGLISPGG